MTNKEMEVTSELEFRNEKHAHTQALSKTRGAACGLRREEESLILLRAELQCHLTAQSSGVSCSIAGLVI